MLVSNQDKPSTPEPNFPCRLDRTCDSLTHVQYVLKARGAQRSGRGVTGGNRGNEDVDGEPDSFGSAMAMKVYDAEGRTKAIYTKRSLIILIMKLGGIETDPGSR